MRKKSLYAMVVSVLALAMVAACAPSFAPTPGYDYAVEEAAAPREAVMSTAAVERDVAQDEKAVSGSGGGEYATIERLIIRNAYLDLVVPDTQETIDAITQMTARLGGFIVEANTSKYQEGLRAYMSLRIPAEKLDEALGELRDMATEVRSENISGQDVTEEYVDLDSRLRNLERTEAKLQEFLDEAEDTEAALAVLEQLTQVTGEIEQVKGRMDYLQESAAMSQVTLELTPDEMVQPIEVGGWRPAGTLRNALQRLVKIMQGVVDAAIVIVLNVIPVLIVLAIPVVVLVLIIRALGERGRAKKAAKAALAAELEAEEVEASEAHV